MKEFGFSLAADTFLRESPDGYSLLSRAPVRVLRLNESLYRLIVHVQRGGRLADFISQHPGLEVGNLLQTLFLLVSKGYLKLDNLAETGTYPSVSIIIPVRNQPGDLGECLFSLANLDYPENKLQIIVIDDGSKKDVSQIITAANIKIIRHRRSLGPAECRNIGARVATGDILAFLDADCLAGENWLEEIVPFFEVEGVGAVGGLVSGYRDKTMLDRYEAIASSLSMGQHIMLEGKTDSTFYVPTANMLVKRSVFMATGGFRRDLHIGEDVDFCWRLREQGLWLLYVPFGNMAHKHRNQLYKMLLRRGQYGTSESVLYRAHNQKRKSLAVPVLTGLAWLSLALAVLLLNPYPLIAVPVFFLLALQLKRRSLDRINVDLNFWDIFNAVFRSYAAFIYFTHYHLARYYLALFIGFGFLWHPLWILGALALVYASVIDYYVKKPHLGYQAFLFYYGLDHLAYQTGVFWGCLKNRYFGSYRVSFRFS
jgi:mycofactocin system glycosyltransferase